VAGRFPRPATERVIEHVFDNSKGNPSARHRVKPAREVRGKGVRDVV
jgi:hypothetical protein